MAENNANVEIAHQLNENALERRDPSVEEEDRFEIRTEILEAFLLAFVAVATAWSGYQSALWDGHSAAHYAHASVQRVDGDGLLMLASEQRLQDISTFESWLLAKTTQNPEMAALLERRFSEDYEPAFRSWLATEPFSNESAPRGPSFMPEYKNHLVAEGEELRRNADESLELGHSTRETGEDYVRVTVFLATVLFMIAIAQRFHYRVARLGLLCASVLATAVILAFLFAYPMG
jgi:hypothetical protein